MVSGLHVPGQNKLTVRTVPSQNSASASFVQASPAGVEIMIAGGFTRLEEAALRIAAAIVSGSGCPGTSDEIAEESVAIARAVLVAAADRRADPT